MLLKAVQTCAFNVNVYSNIFSSVGISSPWAFKLSIYNSIASLAFAIDSSTVSPYVMQPGREGTNTVNPPSGSFFNNTLKFNIFIFYFQVYMNFNSHIM